MKKISLSDKLIIASFILSVVIITIVATFSFYRAKSAILERSFNQLNSVRTIKSNLIENFFQKCQEEIRLAKSSSDIQQLNAQLNSLENKKAEFKEIKSLKSEPGDFIQEINKEYYSRIYIIGKNRLIYSLKKNFIGRKEQEYSNLWQKTIASKTIYIQDFSLKDSLNPASLTFSAKILDDKHQLQGIIAFEILPNIIDSSMLNRNPASGLGQSGETYLVGSDYLMRSSSRFQKNSILRTQVNTEVVDSAFFGLSGAKLVKDYRGIKVLSSYGKISVPYLHWVILAEIDYHEVTIPIYKIRDEIVFVSIFIFLIVLVAIIVLSKKITSPIKKLNRAVHEVGLGNLDVEIGSSSNDEIGELSSTFDQMIKKLKSQTLELEKEKSKSLRSLIDGQESERQRLSRELHDSLGQLLIALKLKFENCIDQSLPQSGKFEELSTLFDQTIEETRRISNNLMPAALEQFGLTTAIRAICNEITENTSLLIHYRVKGSSQSLHVQQKTYLFRIIQEALTNIIKHADAQQVLISLNFNSDRIQVRIEDDGRGFNPSENKSLKSNGLNNISDRVSLLSGDLKITSSSTEGTKLFINLPIKTVLNEKD